MSRLHSPIQLTNEYYWKLCHSASCVADLTSWMPIAAIGLSNQRVWKSRLPFFLLGRSSHWLFAWLSPLSASNREFRGLEMAERSANTKQLQTKTNTAGEIKRKVERARRKARGAQPCSVQLPRGVQFYPWEGSKTAGSGFGGEPDGWGRRRSASAGGGGARVNEPVSRPRAGRVRQVS